ncbi:MAG: hypothetical protein V1835_06635 [Candidatus Micrarchaeota archaeon]
MNKRSERSPLADKAELRRKYAESNPLKPGWVHEDRDMPLLDILKGLLAWRSKVVYVGSGAHVWKDPLPFFIAQEVRSRNLTVVEPQGIRLSIEEALKKLLAEEIRNLKRQDAAKSNKGRKDARATPTGLHSLYGRLISIGNFTNKINGKMVSGRQDLGFLPHRPKWRVARAESPLGIGSLKQYRDSIRDLLRGFTHAGKKNNVRFQIGLAWDTGIKPGTVDLLVDKGTHDYLTAQNKLQDSVKHYLELLKKGGKLVFFSRNEEFLIPQLKILMKTGKVHIARAKVIRSKDPLFRRDNHYPSAFIVTKLG